MNFLQAYIANGWMTSKSGYVLYCVFVKFVLGYNLLTIYVVQNMLLLCVDFKSNNHLHNYMYNCTKYLVKLYSCTAVLYIVQLCTQVYVCSVYGGWPTRPWCNSSEQECCCTVLVRSSSSRDYICSCGTSENLHLLFEEVGLEACIIFYTT